MDTTKQKKTYTRAELAPMGSAVTLTRAIPLDLDPREADLMWDGRMAGSDL